MKKGQMEIIGLLMIVILLVVIMAFWASFSATPKRDVVGVALAKSQSASLLSAITSYTVCPGNDMEKAVETCNKDSTQIICGRTACDLFEDTAETILQKYFGKHKNGTCCVKPFAFFLDDSAGNNLAEIKGGLKCTNLGLNKDTGLVSRACSCGGRAAISKARTINLFPGRAYVWLYRCS
jgi:hypothetical protein